MKHTLKTNMKTIGSLWNTLKDLNLQGLISGETVEVKIFDLVDQLLSKGKLQEMIETIVVETIDFDELEFAEVVEIISNFFASIGSQLKGLSQLKAMTQAKKAEHPIQTHSTESIQR
ncbi:MAG TPA: hypothetical protein PK816_14640 [Candidatus Cloacimonadota bacterium]|nr:hypothetical protein [Candidatus Cloacimonadota bacterium]